jgi:hypothetical protein
VKLLPCLAFLILPLVARAEDMTEERFKSLVAGLASEDAVQRQEAQGALAGLEESWKPKLEEALKAATDPEAKARLREVLEGLGRPRWIFNVDQAVTEATRLKRPLLVLCAVGTPLDLKLASTRKLIEETLAPAETVKVLRERFVILWIDLHAAAGEQHAGRAGDFLQDTEEGLGFVDGGSEQMAVETMICTPAGKVCHAVGGWWPADTWRAEIQKGLVWADMDAEKAVAARKEAFEAIQAEANRLEAEAAATEGGDEAKTQRSDMLGFLSRRYQGYSAPKIGMELRTAVDDAVTDYIGRESDCR